MASDQGLHCLLAEFQLEKAGEINKIIKKYIHARSDLLLNILLTGGQSFK